METGIGDLASWETARGDEPSEWMGKREGQCLLKLLIARKQFEEE
jgi:hypothetical protein